MEENKKFIVALDIGTTNVKCFIYNEDLQFVGKAVDQVTLLHPEVGYCEMDPEQLWSVITNVVKNAIEDGKVTVTDVLCLGISSQRCSFITWNRHTQIPYHNFITWKDVRANELVNVWNNSFLLKTVRFICRCLYWITKNVYFSLIANTKFMNAQVTFRLIWLLNNLSGLKHADKRNVMFGTIDCWLLYKLTGTKSYCTDFSCVSSTGMFDPYRMKWAVILPWLGIPRSVALPSICQSYGHHFGTVIPEIWGASIPITCVMADQMASLYGCGCVGAFDVKATLGTGGFLDVNVGSKLRISKNGLYPLIGCVINDEVLYVLEGCCYNVATMIEWIKSINLSYDVTELSELAYTMVNCHDLYFVPFPNLQISTYGSATDYCFVGIKPTTTRGHIVRAILESIVFRMYKIYHAYEFDNMHPMVSLWIDGGVSRNDFVCQCLADMIGVFVKRSANADCSAVGVAFLAGLTMGVWKSKDDIQQYVKMDKMFIPDMKNRKILLKTYNKWNDLVNRLEDTMK